MKKSDLFFLLTAIVLLAFTPAEICQSELFKKGTVVTMSNYDAKGELQSTSTSTITSVSQTTSGMSADMHAVSSDRKGKETSQMDVKLRCEEGKFYMDMKSFLASTAKDVGKDITLDFEGTDMQYPSAFTVDETLPDATIKMTGKLGEQLIMSTSIRIYNRKVLAKESRTTPAGTFECWKIGYDIDLEMGMVMGLGKIPIKPMHSIEWYCPTVSVVRVESYCDEKLQSYSELTKIVRP
jgi:hypothetical protein